MLFAVIPNSQAELWELQIDLSVQNGVVNSGETIIITGKVVDQAYKPIRGAEVLIRAGSDTTKASEFLKPAVDPDEWLATPLAIVQFPEVVQSESIPKPGIATSLAGF